MCANAGVCAGAGALRGRPFGVAGIVIGILMSCGCYGNMTAVGLAAVPFSAAESLEEGDRDETSGIGQGGVAGLVPIRVIFLSNDMEEIAAREAELLVGLCFVVVKRSDDLA